MPKTSLISIEELVRVGWKQYIRDWKKLLEISIRFLFAGLVQLAFAMIAERLSSEAGTFLMSVGLLIGYVIIIHTAITLMDYLLQCEEGEGKKAIRWKRGMDLFWSYIWIVILVSLATLGGLILLVLPGIWLSVLFAFSVLVMINEGRKGTQALSRSAELVKGRWWATFWRLVIPYVIVILIGLVASFLLTTVVGLFAGGFDSASNYLSATEYSPLRMGISQVLDSLISIAIVPLAVIYQVRLYISLKRTAS